MKIYRISEQNAAAERSATLRRTGFITGAAVLVGVMLTARIFLTVRNAVFMATWLGTMAMIVVFLIWRTLAKQSRFLSDFYSTFQITDDGQTISKSQKNAPDVSLIRAEVKRIDEYDGKGFRICTHDTGRNIWIPCELDAYEQLKAELLLLPGVELRHQSNSWLKSYGVVGVFLALIAVSVISKNKIVVAGASLFVSGYLFFGLLKHYRNPNLTTRAKRQLLWGAFVGLCLVGRAIIVWRS